MEQHLKGFLRDLEVRNYSPLSLLKFARCLRMFLDFLNRKGFTDIKKVGRDELREYSEILAEHPKYSVSYVGFNIRTVKYFFRYLKKTNVILFDFSGFLKEPKLPQTLPKEPLTLAEVKLLLEVPDLRTEAGIRNRAILETFYSSGIRVQEMSNLTLFDLDLENGFLFIREGKGKRDRAVPLGKHACHFIQNYLESVRPLLVLRDKQPKAVKTGRLWINKSGRPLLKGDIIWMVMRCRKKAGITKQVTPHSFRRTLAVELIRNECDFLTVKSILGHANSNTTLRYCALSGVELKEALKKSHPRYDGDENCKPQIKSFKASND